MTQSVGSLKSVNRTEQVVKFSGPVFHVGQYQKLQPITPLNVNCRSYEMREGNVNSKSAGVGDDFLRRGKS